MMRKTILCLCLLLIFTLSAGCALPGGARDDDDRKGVGDLAENVFGDFLSDEDSENFWDEDDDYDDDDDDDYDDEDYDDDDDDDDDDDYDDDYDDDDDDYDDDDEDYDDEGDYEIGDGAYGKNGNLEIDMDGELDLPAGYPQDIVPLYKPVRIGLTNKFETYSGGVGYEVQFRSGALIEDVHEYYAGLLDGAEGFQDMDMDPTYMMGGIKSGYGITLMITPSAADPHMSSVTIGLEEISE